MLVIVASPEAAHSQLVRAELEAYSQLGRPIILIAFDPEVLAAAVWFPIVQGLTWVAEERAALETGVPSSASAFHAVDNAVQFHAFNRRLRWFTLSVTGIVVSLALLAVSLATRVGNATAATISLAILAALAAGFFFSHLLRRSSLYGASTDRNKVVTQADVESAIRKYYSCFISYATQDKEFVERLYTDLTKNSVRCWYAPYHIQGGKKIHEQIVNAIRGHDRLLLVLSESSIASRWVKTEIANARQKEHAEDRQVLFPIGLVPYEKLRQWNLFDADIGDDSARAIRECFIPDFSNWRDEKSYVTAIQKLVNDLRA